jgi:hypothetical protein
MGSRRHIDRKAVAESALSGGAERLRDLITRDTDSDRQRRQRQEWPELWETIDSLVERVTVIRGPWRPPPGPSLFDGSTGPRPGGTA